MAQRPHGLLDSYECGPLQILNLLKTLCVVLLLHLENAIAWFSCVNLVEHNVML